MTHPILEVLSSLLDDELGADERLQVESHIESCGECRNRLDRLRRVVQTLADLESAAPPAQLGHSVRRALVATGNPQNLRARLETAASRWIVPAATLSTFAVVAAMAIIVYLLAWGLGEVDRARQVSGEGLSDRPPLQHGPASAIGSGSSRVEGRGSAESGPSSLMREIAGINFVRRGDVWEQQGLEGSQAGRTIDAGSQAGQEWLRSHPDLSELAQLGGAVRVRVGTEILELRFPSPLVDH